MVNHPDRQGWIEDEEQLKELAENGYTIMMDAHGNEHAINATEEIQEKLQEVVD